MTCTNRCHLMEDKLSNFVEKSSVKKKGNHGQNNIVIVI